MKPEANATEHLPAARALVLCLGRCLGLGLRLGLGLGLALGWQSCGYTMGYSPVRPGIRTIAIAVVDNFSFRQRLERDLTRDLGKKLGELSGYRRAPRHLADAILRVQIVAVRNTSLVIGLQDPASGSTVPVGEGALDAIANIELVARRDGRTLVSTRIRDIAEYLKNRQ